MTFLIGIVRNGRPCQENGVQRDHCALQQAGTRYAILNGWQNGQNADANAQNQIECNEEIVESAIVVDIEQYDGRYCCDVLKAGGR